MNPNQRIQGPFGDIFTPNTSHTDQLANRLFMEQKQKEQRDLQAVNNLDKEFTSNLYKIRDVDSEDLTALYNDYKTATIDAMKNAKGQTPAQQMKLLKKKAALYNHVNGSIMQKEHEHGNAKGVISKGGKGYIDYAGDVISADMKKPLRVLVQEGRVGANYIYDGSNFDLGKAMKEVTGDRSMLVEGKLTTSKDGVWDETPVYQTYKNDPETIKRNLLGKMSLRDAGKAFTESLGNLEPEEMVRTDAEFKAIPDSVWSNLGIKKPDLTVKNPYNEYEQAANYYAQKIALEQAQHGLSPVKTKKVENKLSKERRSFDTWKKKNEITYGQSLVKIAANRNAATPNYNETTGNSLDEFRDTETQGGKKIVNGAVFNEDGTPYSSPKGQADIYVTRENIPANLLVSLKAGGIGDVGNGVNIEVKDGVIVGLQTKRNGYISRLAVENAQKKFNTEPIKAAQPQFGTRTTTPSKPKPAGASGISWKTN